MYLFQTAKELQNHLQNLRNQGLTIGFVPTMGALHAGHLSLIEEAKKMTNCSVCSIFVNPTQFNDPKDLEKYPRMPDKDAQLLESVGNDVLFMPPVEEVYPPNLNTKLDLDFGPMATVMEGAFRPGHFDGMAQVVKRLLDLVSPQDLFMGQKDFQQFTIVKSMIQQLGIPTRLVMGATVRERDGLAMSSRNVRLTPEDRQKAPVIFETLNWAKSMLGILPIPAIQEQALQKLQAPGFRPEYFDIVNGDTLMPIEAMPGKHAQIVACTALWVGNVRLIDNLILEMQ
jgi:pantoate--beta-alanine ligase